MLIGLSYVAMWYDKQAIMIVVREEALSNEHETSLFIILSIYN